MDIDIPRCDVHFDENCTGKQSFTMDRSETNPSKTIRTQVNQLTAWLDASQVYGSSQTKGDSLRLFQGGKLNLTYSQTLIADERGGYLTGDVRAN